MENRLSEYWSIMDFAQRGYLGRPTHFAREYATPIQTHRDAKVAERLRKHGAVRVATVEVRQVHHFDLWWNPAVEAQATDRAYRIGQKRNVQVHRFITRGTFEERINELIRAKRELAEMTVGTGEAWVGQLPTNELRHLFRLS